MANTATPSPAKRGPVSMFQRGDTCTSVFRELKTNDKGRTWRSYSVSVQRSWYDTKSDERKYTSTLFDSDLLDAAQGIQAAYAFIEDDRRKKLEADAEADKAAEAVA